MYAHADIHTQYTHTHTHDRVSVMICQLEKKLTWFGILRGVKQGVGG